MHGANIMPISQVLIGDELKIVSEDGSFTAVLVEANPDEGLTFEQNSTGLTTVISFKDTAEYDFYPRGETIVRLSRIEKDMHREEAVVSEVIDVFDPNISDDEELMTINPRPLHDFIVGDEITVAALDTEDIDITLVKVVGTCYSIVGETGIEVDIDSNDFNTSHGYDFYPRGATVDRLKNVPITGLVGSKHHQEEQEQKIEKTSQEFFELYEKYREILPEQTQVALFAYDELSRLAITDDLKDALEFIAEERNQKVTEAFCCSR